MELLNSIFNGIPIPAVILYRIKGPMGAVKHEVMDGKQRLETIFHFRYDGIIKDEKKLGFWLRRDESKKREWFFYKDLKSPANRPLTVTKFLDYKLPVVEYSGELVGLKDQKIAQREIFAKINSTGSKLTKNEIRHSELKAFFRMGDRLENRWKRKMVDKWRVFSKAEFSRYQYHEFMLELCTIIENKGISDKRKVLDKFMRTPWRAADLTHCEKDVNAVMDWIARIFRNDDLLRASRFSKKSDFYTLFAVLADLHQNQRVTMNGNLNRQARKTLINFSKKANRIDVITKKYQASRVPVKDRAFQKYIVSTREGTDQLRNRRARDQILRTFLESIFTKMKSTRRIFLRAQKGQLWLNSNPRKGKIWCPNPYNNPNCLGRMEFAQCEVDHRFPYVKGGATDTNNGQLLCRSCNRRKSAR